MIPLRDIDVLGVFVTPAIPCFLAALAVCTPLRFLLDRLGIDRYVWNRALFDLGILAGATALLILSLRFGAA